MSTGTALAVRDVTVSYGQDFVLDSINLTIREGETYGLIGLNGAGKTTLIKSILALRTPEGEIEVLGRDYRDSEVRYKVAYLPERFNPSWFLTGMEFLKFSAQLYRQPFDEDRALRYTEKLALAPEALRRRAHTYSKGMRQKLGLIATLLTPCPFLILDEPMSGLDPQARALMKEALREAHAEGRTVFLCSHILSDIRQICDNIGVMQKGRLVFTGSPAALLEAGGDEDLEQAFLNVVVGGNAAQG